MRCARPAAADADVTAEEPAESFAAAMAHVLAQGAPWPGAVAVSGGGDSLALMLLLKDWAAHAARPQPVVLTVDHGLVPHSARVAAATRRTARRHGLKAHMLVWSGTKPSSDIEGAARAARYALLGAWCARHDVAGLYVAHTLEDQAETVLLRLARGSGLDGLAAMRPVASFPAPGFERLRVVRPLLGFERAALRRVLEVRGEAWHEDPMNADERFARVRIRRAWPELEALGLVPARIAATAQHLARARDALEEATREFLDGACRFDRDRILIDGARLAEAPPEIGLRALAHILARLSGEAYRPRFERLQRLYDALCGEEFRAARTLQGCRIGRAPRAERVFGAGTLVAAREPPRRRRVAARG